jgi:MFS family permease
MSRPSVFANRDFLLLWSGNAVSQVGFHGVRIAYPLLALSLTGSVTLAGWVGFAISLPGLVFQLPAGMAADYGDRRRILLACQVSGLAATCLAALVVVLQPPNAGLFLVVAAFVEGSAYVFFGISELATIRDIVAVEQRPAAFSFFEAEQPIAMVVGRAAGAAAYGLTRWAPFAANAASYVFCLATLSAIRKNAGPSATDRERTGDHGWHGLRAGFRIVWAESFLRTSTLTSGLSNMVIQVVILLIIVDLEGSGRPVWTVGVVLGAAGAGGIAGSFAASWLTGRFSARSVYIGALWGWTVLVLPISLSSDPLVVGAAWFGVGAIGTVVNVALTLFRVRVIPEDVLGRAVGTVSVVTDGAVALGAVGAGYLLTVFGTAVTGWLLVGAMFTLAVAANTTGRAVNTATGARAPEGEERAPLGSTGSPQNGTAVG